MNYLCCHVEHRVTTLGGSQDFLAKGRWAKVWSVMIIINCNQYIPALKDTIILRSGCLLYLTALYGFRCIPLTWIHRETIGGTTGFMWRPLVNWRFTHQTSWILESLNEYPRIFHLSNRWCVGYIILTRQYGQLCLVHCRFPPPVL